MKEITPCKVFNTNVKNGRNNNYDRTKWVVGLRVGWVGTGVKCMVGFRNLHNLNKEQEQKNSYYHLHHPLVDICIWLCKDPVHFNSSLFFVFLQITHKIRKLCVTYDLYQKQFSSEHLANILFFSKENNPTKLSHHIFLHLHTLSTTHNDYHV